MSFVQRELTKIAIALQNEPEGNRYKELYAAQQALSWSMEPGGSRSPSSMILDTPEDATNYSLPLSQLPS